MALFAWEWDETGPAVFHMKVYGRYGLYVGMDRICFSDIMIQQGRPKQLVDQLSPHRCREWHSDQTSDCLRLMPSLGGEHPSKKQKSEEVTSKPSDGPKLDSVRAPARGSKDGVPFAPLAFFLPETMPFLDPLKLKPSKSDEELASLKVALADLPVPLLSRFWAVLPPAAYSFTASMPRASLL
ncbi:hypothetical protein S83_006936 [Arachis hypogaea]